MLHQFYVWTETGLSWQILPFDSLCPDPMQKNTSRVALYFLLVYIYMFVCVWLCMHVVLWPFVACFNAVSRLWEVSTGVDVQMHVFISHETCQKKVIFHLKIQAKIGTFYLAWRELKVEFSVFLMWHYLLDNLSTFAPSKWLMSLLPRRASRGFWGKKTQWNAF